jgi:hypothetical protein
MINHLIQVKPRLTPVNHRTWNSNNHPLVINFVSELVKIEYLYQLVRLLHFHRLVDMVLLNLKKLHFLFLEKVSF